MKVGYLFPGQGAQSVGMCKDLYEKYEEVRDVYKRAGEILNIDIAKLTFDASEEELCETKNTQIAILVMSLAILEVLKKYDIKVEVTAGLSLGEYTALIFAKMLEFEDGIKLVRKRGELMQSMVPKGNWSMAAIIGLEDSEVEKACKQANNFGFVVPANYNCPKQVVISGEKDAVLEAMRICKERGAKLARELKTGGPFHTEKLQSASNALYNELDKVEIKNIGDVPVVKNIDGKIYDENDDINKILSKHITNPVRFKEDIQTMLDNGIDTFIEIGPGKVLSGFVKKINSNVKILNINNVETLDKTLEELVK